MMGSKVCRCASAISSEAIKTHSLRLKASDSGKSGGSPGSMTDTQAAERGIQLAEFLQHSGFQQHRRTDAAERRPTGEVGVVDFGHRQAMRRSD
jgi:hypothetical protein